MAMVAPAAGQVGSGSDQAGRSETGQRREWWQSEAGLSAEDVERFARQITAKNYGPMAQAALRKVGGWDGTAWYEQEEKKERLSNPRLSRHPWID